jgi:DNA-binding transcriptional ArsR family regulator
MEESAGGGEDKEETRDSGEVDYIDQNMARALAHPLRIQILAELNKRTESPSEFSKRHNEKLQNVSYHFRELRKFGCIEEVESRPVRGAIEHFYRATRRVLFDGKAWSELPQSIKVQASGRAMSDFLEAVSIAMLSETFDSTDERVAVWFQRRLDKQGWEDAVAAHWALIHRMEDIFGKSAIRLAEAGEPDGGIVGTYGLFLFESPPPEPEQRDESDSGAPTE